MSSSVVRGGTVVIGGGSGFIGQHLFNRLSKNGWKVVIVSRKPGAYSITWEDIKRNGLPEECKAVVNVAGQNVLDPTRRWTPGFMQNVYASRIHTTKSLTEAIKAMKVKPNVFASISGVGFYPASTSNEYTEESQGGKDYFGNLCQDWEAANNVPPEMNVRRVIVRAGIVLGRQGGMIQQLYWHFYFGLGAKIGTGKQFMPYIHIDDLAGIFQHAIESNKVSGVLNGVAPQVITNEDFTRTFAKALHRPAFFTLPDFLIKASFGQVRAAIMTEGQKVLPKRTLSLGYKYQFEDIESAIQQCVRKS